MTEKRIGRPTNEVKKITLTIVVPEEYKRVTKKMAIDKGMTVSDMIMQWIDEHRAEEESK